MHDAKAFLKLFGLAGTMLLSVGPAVYLKDLALPDQLLWYKTWKDRWP